MKTSYSTYYILGRKVEITEVNREYFVFIDGLPLDRPHLKGLSREQHQARFSSASRARRAAKMAIARDKKPYYV